ncbi:amino acid adenylation domain-containing protein [Streptomyces sp. NPDC059828]|uniref:non-ribosomal peptide synthetase n=1 Tax=Streptomyces sp. NPDC059828 TaxID=3346965 RepID=UPI0036638627
MEEWVRRRPDSLAVHDPVTGKSLTYAELWHRAGGLAGALAGMGIGKGDLVAVDLRRSTELVVAFLGIVRAGAAYLPLDAQAPRERVAGILAESAAAAAVIAQDTEPDRMPSGLRTLTAEAAADGQALYEAGGEDPVYVTYTSGSTGRPKGVVIPHRAVIRLVTGPNYCVIEPGERVANTCNPAFDVTTCEIWSTLTSGGTVVPFPTVTDLTMEDWIALVRDERIATMFLTTSLFHTVAWEQPGAFATLRNLVVGGEQLDLSASLRVLAAEPPARLVNGYGPTEATAFATYFECTPESLAGRERVPIGYPLQQTTAHVLGDDLAEVPPGEPGELCLGGPGVALGYLGRPDLTADRFVTEPRTGDLVYRTGDLVRLLPDGALEMLGRRDRQVKLRGFRIELEEIEQAAVATGLADAAFIEKIGEGTAAELVGCVLPDSRSSVPDGDLPGALTARLGERLPPYMVPLRWLVLSELPIGATGKADRARIAELLARQTGGTEAGAPDVLLPDDEIARTVQKLWQDVLGAATVSPGDNFIDMGGNSILATQLASRIQKQVPLRLEPADILLADSLADLVGKVRAAAE